MSVSGDTESRTVSLGNRTLDIAFDLVLLPFTIAHTILPRWMRWILVFFLLIASLGISFIAGYLMLVTCSDPYMGSCSGIVELLGFGGAVLSPIATVVALWFGPYFVKRRKNPASPSISGSNPTPVQTFAAAQDRIRDHQAAASVREAVRAQERASREAVRVKKASSTTTDASS